MEMSNKNLHFSFRMDFTKDEEIIKKLQLPEQLGFKSKTEMFRVMIRNYFENPIIDDVDGKIKAEKLKNLQKQNIKLDIDNRIKLIHTLHKEPSDVYDISNGTKTLDENAIHCPDCSWFTNSKDSQNYQVNSLTNHMKSVHKRALTEKEAEELTRLLI